MRTEGFGATEKEALHLAQEATRLSKVAKTAEEEGVKATSASGPQNLLDQVARE